MLELLRASHVTRLIYLANDDGVAEVLLAVISHHTQRSSRRPTIDVGRPVLSSILAVVHTLEGIDDEEERLLLVAALVTQCVTLLEKRRHVGLTTGVEAVLKVETLSNKLDLEEGFLSRVEQDDLSLIHI